ncbi:MULTISPECIES: hypothetical protein [Bacillus subtilis group]|uniref:hypothetical protein n=1 Tax=Bacillus subtilis group TaxID=653685 RepID=UPI0005B56ACC|nr:MULTISPECIES: hypothetical protein [Bacillus subtilis group]AJO16797.1 hypothetical protein SC10_B2orf00929 [Bacillus paralicheniformis]MCR2018097.1 hypothetical protein [Bacillus paralicheniformis]PLS10624.1 hypothetical protein CWM45_20510 [Bacillus licheniformis]TWM10294.1 hypothetical protein CHCC15136_0293 [Bacillus paralicheniformis]TWM50129.1 hypothetical protein CHCC14817_4011 [Bacillus paralicheniformis]
MSIQNENKSTAAATEVEIEKPLKELPESVRIAILANIEKAKKTEITIGIDPESYLAKEILWHSRKMIKIEHKLDELNIAINHLRNQLNKINQQ